MIGVMIIFRLSMLKGTKDLHVGLPFFGANEMYLAGFCTMYRVSDFLSFSFPPEIQVVGWQCFITDV